MTVDIGSLRESPCYLPRLAPRFQCKTVRGQFNAINAAKTAPEKIVRTIDRDIADILCGIEVKPSVVGPYYSRIGSALVYYRITV